MRHILNSINQYDQRPKEPAIVDSFKRLRCSSRCSAETLKILAQYHWRLKTNHVCLRVEPPDYQSISHYKLEIRRSRQKKARFRTHSSPLRLFNQFAASIYSQLKVIDASIEFNPHNTARQQSKKRDFYPFLRLHKFFI